MKKIHRKIKFDEASYNRQRERKANLPENRVYGVNGAPDVRRDMMLLACLLWIPLDHITHDKRLGRLEIAQQVTDALHRAFEVMTRNMRPEYAAALSRKLLDEANTCLKATNADDGRGAALAAAALIVKLVDEGLIRDATSNIVNAALLVVGEASEERPSGPWGYREDWVLQAAQRVWDRAQIAGYLQAMTPEAAALPARRVHRPN